MATARNVGHADGAALLDFAIFLTHIRREGEADHAHLDFRQLGLRSGPQRMSVKLDNTSLLGGSSMRSDGPLIDAMM
jgi:hypothetical protein